MKIAKCWVIQGDVQKRGRTDLEFLGVADSEEKAFKFVNEHYTQHENYLIECFDISRSFRITAKTIWKNQLFNHADDGHLDPPEKRNEKGFCASMRIWGPYCHVCKDKQMSKLDKLREDIF